MVLSAAQLRSFKDEGVVFLKGLVPRATTAHWRDQIWRTLEASPDDPTAIARAQVHPRLRGAGSEAAAIATPALHELPQIQAIVQQLCDGMVKTVSPDTELIINWGTSAVKQSDALGQVQPRSAPGEWSAPIDGHLDGYGGNRWGGGYMLAATCYVNDVDADGGGFAYWPRSHHAVHKFFRRHPLGLDGQYLFMPEVREQGHRALWGSDPKTYVDPEPRIWAASEGDVCFWYDIIPQLRLRMHELLHELRVILFSYCRHTVALAPFS